MHLKEVINQDLIWPELMSIDKAGIIRELAGNISRIVKVTDSDKLEHILNEREELGSTGIADGIAIPHGKLTGLEKIIIACGRSLKGIDFDSHDSKPTHLFFVLLAPEFAAGEHLKALARLSKLLKSSHFRERLMNAPDSRAMYKIISEEDDKS